MRLEGAGGVLERAVRSKGAQAAVACHQHPGAAYFSPRPLLSAATPPCFSAFAFPPPKATATNTTAYAATTSSTSGQWGYGASGLS